MAGGVLRAVFISILENDPKQMEAVFRKACGEADLDLDFAGFTGDEADDDILVYHSLLDKTASADIIYIRCATGLARFKSWEKYERALSEAKGFPVVFSENEDAL